LGEEAKREGKEVGKSEKGRVVYLPADLRAH
jgi:hypothetical protein